MTEPTWTYYAKNLQATVEVQDMEAFFALIERSTGLDQTMAEAILHSGKPIEHARYKFWAERAKLAKA
jgi:hypothetical protein